MNKGILSSIRNRGILAWVLGLSLISFYILLYWNTNLDNKWLFESKLSQLNQQITSIGTQTVDGKTLAKQKAYIKASASAWRNYKNGYHPKLEEKYYPKADELKQGFSFQRIFKSFAKFDYITISINVKGKTKEVGLLDAFSYKLRGKPSNQWFLYGFLYTVLVFVFGLRFIKKWKHSPYQRMRTMSVMFFQTIMAFLVPALFVYFNTKEFYFHYFWPLKPDYFWPTSLKALPTSMAVWAVMMSFIAVPVLTYFFGKRWYCSWVCGCGALAETMGDDFRHLSDKSEKAWKIEQISIYSVLAIVTIATVLLFINEFRGVRDGFSTFAFGLKKWYGFFISAGFAGVIGTGFYPLAGSRVWCRFGCPQAAILGIIQVFFSRFRITTNGDQCMSCGNCSTYCEMGIDVRSYAMTGQDILRASCVGCGVCAAVCPRGVLKLETGKKEVKLG